MQASQEGSDSHGPGESRQELQLSDLFTLQCFTEFMNITSLILPFLAPPSGKWLWMLSCVNRNTRDIVDRVVNALAPCARCTKASVQVPRFFENSHTVIIHTFDISLEGQIVFWGTQWHDLDEIPIQDEDRNYLSQKDPSLEDIPVVIYHCSLSSDGQLIQNSMKSIEINVRPGRISFSKPIPFQGSTDLRRLVVCCSNTWDKQTLIIGQNGDSLAVVRVFHGEIVFSEMHTAANKHLLMINNLVAHDKGLRFIDISGDNAAEWRVRTLYDRMILNVCEAAFIGHGDAEMIAVVFQYREHPVDETLYGCWAVGLWNPNSNTFDAPRLEGRSIGSISGLCSLKVGEHWYLIFAGLYFDDPLDTGHYRLSWYRVEFTPNCSINRVGYSDVSRNYGFIETTSLQPVSDLQAAPATACFLSKRLSRYSVYLFDGKTVSSIRRIQLRLTWDTPAIRQCMYDNAVYWPAVQVLQLPSGKKIIVAYRRPGNRLDIFGDADEEHIVSRMAGGVAPLLLGPWRPPR